MENNMLYLKRYYSIEESGSGIHHHVKTTFRGFDIDGKKRNALISQTYARLEKAN